MPPRVGDRFLQHSNQALRHGGRKDPYLSADHACYAFKLPEYSKHFTCVAVDLRGTGTTDKPAGPCSTEQMADDVAGLMEALDIGRAHVAGVSFGAAAGMWLAAKYPERVASLSLNSAWAKTDPFLATVVNGWRVMAQALGNVAEMVIQGIFPWCFTPEMYAQKPEFVVGLEEFVRGRPPQPVEAFLHQSDAVLAHDAEAQLGRIVAPTQVTFGRRDLVTSTRFAPALTGGIKDAELFVFEQVRTSDSRNSHISRFWAIHSTGLAPSASYPTEPEFAGLQRSSAAEP